MLRILRGRNKHVGVIDDNASFDKDTQVEFVCKCGQQKAWIYDGQILLPCPVCGRKYRGKYNPKTLTIDAIEIKE